MRAPTKRRLRTHGRHLLALLGATLAVFVLLGGPTGSTTTPSEAICIGPRDDKQDLPQSFQGGYDALALTPDGSVAVAGNPKTLAEIFTAATTPLTANEAFGTTSAKWTRYDKDCALVGPIVNSVANMLFGMAKTVGSTSSNLYMWATSPDLLDPFMAPVDDVIKGTASSKGLYDGLYLEFLMPVVIIASLWLGWTGIVKKQAINAVQGGAWIVASIACSMVFMANPTAFATGANDLVSESNSAAIEVIVGATSAGGSAEGLCALPDDAEDRGRRMAACSLWTAMIYTPWSVGQFGAAANVAQADGNTEGNCIVNGVQQTDIKVRYLCAQTIMQGQTTPTGDPGQIYESKNKMWEGIKNQQLSNPDWIGIDPGSRINVAFAALVGNLLASLIVIIISFSSVVLALGMVLLLIVAPVFLLIGVHPGFGRGVALKWLELVLGTVLKRFILGLMLAILIGMYQIIIAADMGYLAKIAMLIAVGIAALIYRKPMLEAFNVVQLGGSQTGMEQGHQQAIDRVGRSGGAAAGGGIAAAAAGGGIGAIIGSTAAGAFGGRGSSNAMLAGAQAGASRGKSRGGQAASKRAAAAEAKEKAAEEAKKKAETLPERAQAAHDAAKAEAEKQAGPQGAPPRPQARDEQPGTQTLPATGGAVDTPTPEPRAATPEAPAPRPQSSPKPPTGSLPTRPASAPQGGHDPGGLDAARRLTDEWRNGGRDGSGSGGRPS